MDYILRFKTIISLVLMAVLGLSQLPAQGPDQLPLRYASDFEAQLFHNFAAGKQVSVLGFLLAMSPEMTKGPTECAQ